MASPTQLDTEDLLQRFLRYVRIDTRSDLHSEAFPSTAGQWDLLRLLESELREIGASDVVLTEHGYVLATIPPTSPKKGVPRMAWCGHVDTATNLPSAARPIVHRAYDGRPIILPDDPKQTLSIEETPHLKGAIGKDVITASGATLLGADDKSGVAVVMSAARHLLRHPEIPHGLIRLCFNPDEEIGRGMHKIELAELAADVAYTLDSEELGEIDFETFSADKVELEIEGVASHPGWAKGMMVNAIRLAGRFLSSLPKDMAPETTSEREGFIHPLEIRGTAEKVKIWMLLRDFELEGLAAKRALVEGVVASLRIAEPRARFDLRITEQYRNMRYWLEKDMRPVEFAMEAVKRAGLKPISPPVRGGTDGSNLTSRGLPTPNIFTGMHAVHSEREWIALQDMEKSVETLVHLAQIWVERA